MSDLELVAGRMRADLQGTFTIPCTTNAAVFMQFGDAAFQLVVRLELR